MKHNIKSSKQYINNYIFSFCSHIFCILYLFLSERSYKSIPLESKLWLAY